MKKGAAVVRNIDHVMRKAYDPSCLEFSASSWTNYCQRQQKLESNKANSESFTLCLPPPNITGSLHIGHAVAVALEDALVRWSAKTGLNCAWVPGCDHASIGTQIAVQKFLHSKGISTDGMPRADFVNQVLKWKSMREDEIRNQLSRMGALLDWNRYRFTMDDDYSLAVTEAFCKLHDRGLIYRAKAFVNWCPHLRTSLSDIEVSPMEITKPCDVKVPIASGKTKSVRFGQLFVVNYQLISEGSAEKVELSVATTRPETILGDVALAVHPADTRYTSLIGKRVRNPLSEAMNVRFRELPIIADSAVDPKFGSGILKITPAHDQIDYEIWERHQHAIGPLFNDIFDESGGAIRAGYSELSGLSRFEARDRIVAMLSSLNRLVEVRPHSYSLPICSRSGDIVERRLRSQWFVRCRGRLVQNVLEATERGDIKFVPDFYKATWTHWLTNIKDWCISRQLWWGHRIPAYRVIAGNAEEAEQWIVARSLAVARESQANPSSISLEQDEDVLDTWFSSALYPLAAQGWPLRPIPQSRYPLSLLETGADILFFWVARMVMLCSELAPPSAGSRLPFPLVLLHGIVRDGNGKKMSKSQGNVIDPLQILDGVKADQIDPAARRLLPTGIPAVGPDGMRLALCLQDAHSVGMNVSVDDLVACRRFCNKLWQAVRFVMLHTPESFRLDQVPSSTVNTGSNHAMDVWLLSRLHDVVAECHAAFERTDLRLHRAAISLRNFVHHDLCDTYIEYVKADLKLSDEDSDFAIRQQRRDVVLGLLYKSLLASFDLLHPFMPFLTEELSGIVRNVVALPKVPTLLEVPMPKLEDFAPINRMLVNWSDEALLAVHAARSAIALSTIPSSGGKKGAAGSISIQMHLPEQPLSGDAIGRQHCLALTFQRLLPKLAVVEPSRPDLCSATKSLAVILPLQLQSPTCSSSLEGAFLVLDDNIRTETLLKALQGRVNARLRRQEAASQNVDQKDKSGDVAPSPLEELHKDWLVRIESVFDIATLPSTIRQ